MFEAMIMNLAQNGLEFWVKFETGSWGQKLGYRAKSKEDLINTLEVTFLKKIIMNLA